MTFQKGQIANPTGAKYKRQWINEKRRINAARDAFDRLEEIMNAADTPVKDKLTAIKLILNRTVGLPRVESDGSSEIDPARVFVDTLGGLIRYLARNDAIALSYLQLHIRNFAESMKNGAMLSEQQPSTAIARREFNPVTVDDDNGNE